MNSLSIIIISIVMVLNANAWAKESVDYSEFCKAERVISTDHIFSPDMLQEKINSLDSMLSVDIDLDGKDDLYLICFSGLPLFEFDPLPTPIIIKNPHKLPLVIHNLNIHMASAGQLSVRDNVILSHVTVTGSSQMPVDVEGKSITLDHATIMSSDIGIEIRRSQGVEIANSDIQAITGVSIVSSNEVRISKTHLNVTQLGIELNDAGKPILTDVTFPENENDITENRDIDYILMPDQEKMALDRVGITKIEDEEEKVFVTDIVGLAPSCEGAIQAYRMIENHDEHIDRLESAFTCSIKQVLSYDTICLAESDAADCSVDGNCSCFQKPDCIFECSGLNEPDKNKVIFAHVDGQSQITHLSEVFDLSKDHYSSVPIMPTDGPIPSGMRMDADDAGISVLADGSGQDIGVLGVNDELLAGDEMPVGSGTAASDDLGLEYDGSGGFGSNPGGTAPTTGIHERGEEVLEHTIRTNSDDSDMMDVDLSGLGAQAGTSCSISSAATNSYHGLLGLMVLFSAMYVRKKYLS